MTKPVNYRQMDNNQTLGSINFSIPTTAEIVSCLSVVDITNPMTTVEFDKNNTMFDTRMGAFRNIDCGHCNRNYRECPGHHGRIKLSKPCVNSRFLNNVLKSVLSLYCFECYLRINDCECVKEVTTGTKNVKKRFVKNPSGIKIFNISKKAIGYRHLQGLKYTFVWTNKTEEYTDNVGDVVQRPANITIEELYNKLKKIPRHVYLEDFPQFEKYTDLTEPTFLKYLLVLPTTSRPPNMMGSEWKSDSISRLYVNVLKKSITLDMKNNVVEHHLVTEYHYQLQCAIDILFDISQTNNKLRANVVQSGGIRQRIDGKEGRLRMNLMGKRVEFSARTVLSGDPKLGLNEIGIPRTIADDLTIPETITRYNINKFKYGDRIKYVIKKDGRRYDTKIVRNYRLEIGDVVERCLVNGDIVAVNRQPTLHRGSILACYVRIFDCLTFRLNYSTMITLNADTDGDEINVHVPQDLESRAELECLMKTSTNIVASQASRPLIGCTQDSLLGCYLLSRETTITKNDYMNILYQMDLDDEILDDTTVTHVNGSRFVTPALDHIGIFIDKYEPSSEFLIVNNEIKYGLLNKSIIGASDDSLIHHIFLSVGHIKAAQFIHMLQKAATAFLDMRGFSVGVSDCVVDHEPINFKGLETKLKENFFKNGGKWSRNDEMILTETLGELTKLGAPNSVGDNRLLDMINSGSKGSIANFNQITRVVGQQMEEEGRVSKRFKHRTLPHFHKYDNCMSSRGLVKNSFIKGVNPSEFFMHAMGGRIGLIDTACKTSVTGAQYRRLVKTLEPLIAKDIGNGKRPVVNSSNGQFVQFEYGEDSYDATYLKRLKL